MSNNRLHFVVVAFAILSSLLTALANLLIENWVGLNMLSLSFFVIIPVGAVIIGAGGASVKGFREVPPC